MYNYETLQKWQKVLSELSYLVINFLDLSLIVKPAVHSENNSDIPLLNQYLNF